MRILVCDDNPAQCDLTKTAIDLYGDVQVLAGRELKGALTNLFETVSTLLDGNLVRDEWVQARVFDGFDLVIVDNNLAELDLDGARLTAETIIGYLRAFTDISYIVSLNKNPHVDFDLRYLFGDYQSLADLALNSQHLSNRCLWSAEVITGFAPWYWPRLHDAASRRKDQIEFVGENIEESVWETLGFPTEADEYLSFRAKAALASSADQDVQRATFQAFFDSSRTVVPAEREKLKELAALGGVPAERAVHRIVAYEVDRWLRRDVLGTQDVLIDLPHLVAQMPILLGEQSNELVEWNQVATDEEAPFNLDQALFETHLAPARFGQSMWVPTPCFWWPVLKADEGLNQRFFDAEGDWPEAVFCEDISRFVALSDEGDFGPPQEFEAEIAGSWPRRFVVDVEGKLYSPRSRILGRAT